MAIIRKIEKMFLDKFVKEIVDGMYFYKYQDKVYLLRAKEMNDKQIETLKKTFKEHGKNIDDIE